MADRGLTCGTTMLALPLCLSTKGVEARTDAQSNIPKHQVEEQLQQPGQWSCKVTNKGLGLKSRFPSPHSRFLEKKKVRP